MGAKELIHEFTLYLHMLDEASQGAAAKQLQNIVSICKEHGCDEYVIAHVKMFLASAVVAGRQGDWDDARKSIQAAVVLIQMEDGDV